MDADELIARVTAWSRADRRVTAAGLCGSHARGDARPDSDVDFCILTPNPRLLLDDRDWIYSFDDGARIDENVEDYNLVQSLRAYFGVTEAEFGITDEGWAKAPIDPDTAAVINDGLKILYDPQGRLASAIAYAAGLAARATIETSHA